MFYIETSRLILVQTPLEALKKRLERSDEPFGVEVPLPDGAWQVLFSVDWPGDALVLFPMMIEAWENGLQDELPWGGTLIDRAEWAAVGQMGFKSLPEHGFAEMGYGVIPACQGRGYATEMARALADWALTQPGMERVTAECRTDNVGSIRVLEKAGFARVGERVDEEDGPLYLWEKRT